jgi:hypothetical protein
VHRYPDSNLQSSDYQPDILPMCHCYLVHDFNFRSSFAGVSSVGPPVSGVHALALVHDVAGIHATVLQVFLMLSVLLLLVSMLLSLLMLLLAPLHLLVFWRLLALLLLALLHYEVAA